MILQMKNWFLDIVSYFLFVIARRNDKNNSILPTPSALATFFISGFLVIFCLYYWADPVMLEWFKQPRRRYPEIFNYVTLLGGVGWILVPTGIILFCLSLFNAKQNSGYKNLLWHQVFLHAYFIFTGVVFTGILGNLLKNIVGRSRPQFTPDGYIWFSTPFEHSYSFASFPSGHATTAGAIAIALALLFPRWRWIFYTIGIAVGISRPVLGVHYPSDIAAGLIFGGAVVWIYARIFAKKRLLFEFDKNGRLSLRNEGVGRVHSLGTVTKQANGKNIVQNSTNAIE